MNLLESLWIGISGHPLTYGDYIDTRQYTSMPGRTDRASGVGTRSGDAHAVRHIDRWVSLPFIAGLGTVAGLAGTMRAEESCDGQEGTGWEVRRRQGLAASVAEATPCLYCRRPAKPRAIEQVRGRRLGAFAYGVGGNPC